MKNYNHTTPFKVLSEILDKDGNVDLKQLVCFKEYSTIIYLVLFFLFLIPIH